jgi:hypothetical protein
MGGTHPQPHEPLSPIVDWGFFTSGGFWVSSFAIDITSLLF